MMDGEWAWMVGTLSAGEERKRLHRLYKNKQKKNKKKNKKKKQ